MTPIAPTDWFSEEKWFEKQNGRGRYASACHISQEWRWNDGWMTPFDELVQMPNDLAKALSPAPVFTVASAPPPAAVCIWSAGGPSGSKDGPLATAESCATDGCSSNEVIPSETVCSKYGETVAKVYIAVGPPQAEANKLNQALETGTDATDECLAGSFEPGLADANLTHNGVGVGNVGGDFKGNFAPDQGAVLEQPTLTLPEPVPPPCCHPMPAFPYSFLGTRNGDDDDDDDE